MGKEKENEQVKMKKTSKDYKFDEEKPDNTGVNFEV